MKWIALLLSLLMAGCATIPAARRTVPVTARGQAAEQQANDTKECEETAHSQLEGTGPSAKEVALWSALWPLWPVLGPYSTPWSSKVRGRRIIYLVSYAECMRERSYDVPSMSEVVKGL